MLKLPPTLGVLASSREILGVRAIGASPLVLGSAINTDSEPANDANPREWSGRKDRELKSESVKLLIPAPLVF
jgi:hypothetical protein